MPCLWVLQACGTFALHMFLHDYQSSYWNVRSFFLKSVCIPLKFDLERLQCMALINGHVYLKRDHLEFVTCFKIFCENRATVIMILCSVFVLHLLSCQDICMLVPSLNVLKRFDKVISYKAEPSYSLSVMSVKLKLISPVTSWNMASFLPVLNHCSISFCFVCDLTWFSWPPAKSPNSIMIVGPQAVHLILGFSFSLSFLHTCLFLLSFAPAFCTLAMMSGFLTSAFMKIINGFSLLA